MIVIVLPVLLHTAGLLPLLCPQCRCASSSSTEPCSRRISLTFNTHVQAGGWNSPIACPTTTPPQASWRRRCRPSLRCGLGGARWGFSCRYRVVFGAAEALCGVGWRGAGVRPTADGAAERDAGVGRRGRALGVGPGERTNERRSAPLGAAPALVICKFRFWPITGSRRKLHQQKVQENPRLFGTRTTDLTKVLSRFDL